MFRNSRLSLQGLFWPLLVLGLGTAALLQALEVFPPAVADLVSRAWPVVVLLAGLAVLLDQIGPLRRVAPLIAVVLAGGLLAGIVVLAYSTRAASERDDNVVDFQQALAVDVERLHVTIEALETTVQISPSVAGVSAVLARFVGSDSSEVAIDYAVEDGTGVFTVRETHPDSLPLLGAVGRGRLNVELPLGVPVELDFRTADGTVSLNLLGLRVSRLNVTVDSGDLVLSLPNTALNRRGDVLVAGGSITLFVPQDLGLHLFASSRGDPLGGWDYVTNRDGSYQSRTYETIDEQTELNLTVPAGTIQVN